MLEWSDIWPLFGLQLRTPRLVLRPVRDDDIPGLIEATLAGIHDPADMPFAVPWTREAPELIARNTAHNVWLGRTRVAPDDWRVDFAVLLDDRVVGRQDVRAAGFPDLRTVETGSWLTRAQQGRGLGKEMRAAVLLWAFDHLGAEFAETAAFEDNRASQKVSEAMGYSRNGEALQRIDRGEVARMLRYRLRREELRRPDWELRVDGQEAVARLLGVEGSASRSAVQD